MENEEEKNKISAIVSGGLRSIAASVPVAASLAAAWNEWETNRRFERVEEFLEDVKLEIESADRVEPDDPEGARQLLDLATEIVQREHREEKRKRFAKFFVKNAFGGSTTPFEQKRFFLEVLDKVGEEELRILALFAGRDPLRGDQIQSVVGLEAAVTLTARLASLGLIAPTTFPGDMEMTPIWEGRPDRWDNAFRARWYSLLPLGQGFIESLGG